MKLLALIAVAVAVYLWVRMFRTPDEDAARRRLRRELARHQTVLWEHEDPT